MEIKNVKGCYDFKPEEQKIRNYICDTLKNVFENYGYKSIETPILCHYDMLSDKYDENNDILKEIYRLKDQGNRDLGLRYDLTVPFAKYVALNKNTLSLPFKRYEINRVFRNGPIKVGRDREFTQCDVDVVGLEDQLVEAEMLNLYYYAFKELGINIVLKYNSRNLMKGLILESGINEERVGEVTTIIDKIEKVSVDELISMLIDLGVSLESAEMLIKYFKLSFDELDNMFKNTENSFINRGLRELNELTYYLKDTEVDNVCVFAPSLARGQNYYTGNVFEVYEATGIVKSSIGGGGRYDSMVTEFISDGETYPAVGISFGLSSIFEILKQEERFKTSVTDVLIIPLETKKESLKLAIEIRNLGYKVDIEMKRTKLKKSLEYANRENIPYVIILGESEIENKKFKLKNMINGDSVDIEYNNIEAIKKEIN